MGLQPVYPNVAKIPYRRVGCAHQISLISSVKGGQAHPTLKTQDSTTGEFQRGHSNFDFSRFYSKGRYPTNRLGEFSFNHQLQEYLLTMLSQCRTFNRK
jgi:hypothetical protein